MTVSCYYVHYINDYSINEENHTEYEHNGTNFRDSANLQNNKNYTYCLNLPDWVDINFPLELFLSHIFMNNYKSNLVYNVAKGNQLNKSKRIIHKNIITPVQFGRHEMKINF